MSSEYEIKLDNNEHLKFKVENEEVFINGLSLSDPSFNSIKLNSGDLVISSNGDLNTTGDVTIGGNLQVLGSNTKIETETKVIKDNFIELSYGTEGTPINDSGLIINRGDLSNTIFYWKEDSNSFVLGNTNDDASNIKITSNPFLSIADNSLLLGNPNKSIYTINTNGETDVSFNTGGGKLAFSTNTFEFGKLPFGPLNINPNELLSSIVQNTNTIYATTSSGLRNIRTSSNDEGSGAILNLFATGSLVTTSDNLLSLTTFP